MKKTLSLLLAVCMLVALLPCNVFAIDENKEIKAAIAAVRANEKTIICDNDMPVEEFLSYIRMVLPEGTTVEVSFEKESDYRVYNATEKRDGSIFANIVFKCGVYTRKDMFTMKIPKLDAASEVTKPDDTAKAEETKPTEETKPEVTVAFEDVADDAYYADSVKWAVEKKITAGTSKTAFSPDNTCTRAQILTFLWRAVGSPKAEIENPFTDVKSDDYYYDAAIWSYVMGMVEENEFKGDTPCTRASTVEYLWKNAKAPDVESNSSFKDVSKDAAYSTAVAWAVENKVTSGVSKTEFAPDTICSRGQIVTFLKRAISK